MRETSLPPVFARYAGRVSYVAQRGRYEFSSTCPNCGGMQRTGGEYPDRCRWFTDGKPRGWCRRCGGIFWPDEASGSKITPEEMEQWRREREATELRRKQAAERALEHLRAEKGWLEYVALMDARTRQQWRNWGVPDDWQAYWQLGYLPGKVYYDRSGEEQVSPAYTIPYFHTDFEFVTLQYRLNAADPAQRYRFEKGLRTAYFQTLPSEPIGERALIVEGAKKAMVTHIYGGTGTSVLAVPSKADFGGVAAAVQHCEQVFILLDPDAEARARLLAGQVGQRARVGALPDKVDDFILADRGNAPRLLATALTWARPV